LGPINAQAMAALCALLELPTHQLLPDSVWTTGQPSIYQHLRSNEALSLSGDVAESVLCPDCLSVSVRPVPTPAGAEHPYQCYCGECGWVDLPKERARLWQVNPSKVAIWLNVALGLKIRHPVSEVVTGRLWHLGAREHKRKRHNFFFGCLLSGEANAIQGEIDRLASPGTEAVITTSDLLALQSTNLKGRLFIPLQAIAQLRKGNFAIEGLDAYFDGLAPTAVTDETSLRLLHSKRVALIAGTEISLSPQVYGFLKVLDQADGDEVHKRKIAEALGIAENFRYADIKKHHRTVFDTFVQRDQQGNYWLHPDFLILERGILIRE